MEKVIGLRVDVDFEIGMMRGVPYLLDLFKAEGITATFYVTLGPDGFKNNKSRVKTPGYIKRIMAFNPFNIITKFGPVYLFRQFFGNPGMVGSDHPEVLKKIINDGHEIGVHGYDHFWWAENIWNCNDNEVRQEMNKGLTVFKDLTGEDAKVWASPNWRCSKLSMQIVDELRLSYGADCRGTHPFIPMIDDWTAKTPQFPISLPCLHEIKSYLDSPTDGEIIKEFTSKLRDGYNLWCIHDYYEGILERKLLIDVIRELKSAGYRIVPVEFLVSAYNRDELSVNRIGQKKLPGGRGMISYQEQ